MRTLLFLLALVLAVPSQAGLTVSENGLSGAQPIVVARQSTIGTANLLANFLKGAGSSLPGAAEIVTLDNVSRRYAAGALVGRVPAELWAELMLGKDQDPDQSARIVADFKLYMEQAGAAAAKDNAGVRERLQEAIAEGKLTQAELEDAAAALRGLSAHNHSLNAALAAADAELEQRKGKALSGIVEEGTLSWGQGKRPEELGNASAGQFAQPLAPSTARAGWQAKRSIELPAPKNAPALPAPSKFKEIMRWALPILAFVAVFVAVDWGTKAFAAKHLFNLFHEASWRKPLMEFIIPFIWLTAYMARAPLANYHTMWKWSWKWSIQRLGNGRLGFHKDASLGAEAADKPEAWRWLRRLRGVTDAMMRGLGFRKAAVSGVDAMTAKHPSMKWALRLYDLSIAMMLGGMLGNGLDLFRLGGALDWIPLGRSLMNAADVFLIAGLSFFQLGTRFFLKVGRADAEGKTLRFDTGLFLGLPVAGFFAAWAFGSASSAEPLALAMKSVGFIYLMGFSMLIGAGRLLSVAIIRRFADKFVAEQDQARAPLNP